jgi:hypothetical protein
MLSFTNLAKEQSDLSATPMLPTQQVVLIGCLNVPLCFILMETMPKVNDFNNIQVVTDGPFISQSEDSMMVVIWW